MLIAVEGGDGSGKNYFADLLAKQIRNCTRLDFPDRTTPVGAEIDRRLKEGIGEPLVFQCLQIVNRHERYEDLAQAAGSPRWHTVLVRYTPSAYVYGCTLGGLDERWMADVHRGLPSLDLAILVDVPAEAARAGIESRGGQKEEYEQDELAETVRQAYRDMWKGKPAGQWKIVTREEVNSGAAATWVLRWLEGQTRTSERIKR